MGELKAIPYRFTVRVGDAVRLPNEEIGTVTFVDLVTGGNSKMVFVEPDVVWYKRWWMHLRGQLWFCDKEINKLVLLQRKEDK